MRLKLILSFLIISQICLAQPTKAPLCEDPSVLKETKSEACEILVQSTKLAPAINCSALALGSALSLLQSQSPATLATLAQKFPKLFLGSIRLLQGINLVAVPLTIWSITSFGKEALDTDRKCFENIEAKTIELQLLKLNSEMINAHLPDLNEFEKKQIQFPNEYLSEAFIKNLTCQRLKEIAAEQKRKIDPLMGKALAQNKVSQDPRQILQTEQNNIIKHINCWPIEKKMDVLCTAGNALLLAQALKLKSPQNLSDRHAQFSNAKSVREALEIEQKTLTMLKDGKPIQLQKFDGSSISEGYFVKLDNGLEGIWKPYKSTQVSAEAEVAAYKIDRYLGLNQVPATVLKTVNGEIGSLQLKVSGPMQKTVENQPHQSQMFDYLINNWDRNVGNYFVRKDGKIVNIDHGVAFSPDVYSEDFTDTAQTILKEVSSNKMSVAAAQARVAPLLVSEKTVQQIRQLTPEKLVQLTQKGLSVEERTAFEQRRQIILKTITDLEKKLGKDIYPAGPSSPVFHSNM